MTGNKGTHNIGRPKMEESDKMKYNQKSLYFPVELEYVWREFDKISRRKINIKSYPARCKSIAIRNLIYNTVIKYTTHEFIKEQLIKFKEEDKKKLDEIRKSTEEKIEAAKAYINTKKS